MSISSSDRIRPTSLTEAEAETRTAKLVAEMIQRWRQGERPVAEDFLAWHPELWDHPAAATACEIARRELRRPAVLSAVERNQAGGFPPEYPFAG